MKTIDHSIVAIVLGILHKFTCSGAKKYNIQLCNVILNYSWFDFSICAIIMELSFDHSCEPLSALFIY